MNISKKVLLNVLEEQSHPVNVEDVIFFALRHYYETSRGGNIYKAVAYSIINRIEEEEAKKNKTA